MRATTIVKIEDPIFVDSCTRKHLLAAVAAAEFVEQSA